MFPQTSKLFSTVFLSALLGSAGVACDSDTKSEDTIKGQADAGDDSITPDATPTPGPDAGPCVVDATSVVCADDKTFSFCSEDTDFDGQSDGDPTTVEIGCSAFFRDAGAASCETYNNSTTEALCTMDDGGPCGVFLITGAATGARCTTDDAVCLLDPVIKNYLCTPDTGISCTAGDDFEAFCTGNKLVRLCIADGDGVDQPHVEDCVALGNGVCNAEAQTCTGIQEGGLCNLTDWICDDGLKCQSNSCVPE